MRRMIGVSPTQDLHPVELWHLRVAAYYRNSTELEE